MNILIDISPLNSLNERLKAFHIDQLLHSVSNNALDKIAKRVHVDGIASDGSQIGTYSTGYMKLRSGSFKSTEYVRGKNKGQKRRLFNRGSDTSVILSLTREMENDMKVIKTDDGYGIGFSNSHNYDKAIWSENTYQKAIWELTNGEKEETYELATQIMQEVVNGK